MSTLELTPNQQKRREYVARTGGTPTEANFVLTEEQSLALRRENIRRLQLFKAAKEIADNAGASLLDKAA